MEEKKSPPEIDWAWRFYKLPRRTICAAVLLFAVGSVLLSIGVKDLEVGSTEQGVSLIVMGCISTFSITLGKAVYINLVLAFVPGTYACVQIYGTFREWPGYSFGYLPSYDQ